MKEISKIPNAEESSKREVFQVEISGQKLNVIKEKFEYPEKIQSETKIKGGYATNSKQNQST